MDQWFKIAMPIRIIIIIALAVVALAFIDALQT